MRKCAHQSSLNNWIAHRSQSCLPLCRCEPVIENCVTSTIFAVISPSSGPELPCTPFGRVFSLFISCRSGEKLLKYQANHSCVIMSFKYFFRTAFLRKFFHLRFSYKHCNFSAVCLLVKMASKTMTRSLRAATMF